MKIFKDYNPKMKERNNEYILLTSVENDLQMVDHIVALEAGKVISKTETSLTIEHDDNTKTTYENITEVSENSVILKGEVIGKVEDYLKLSILDDEVLQDPYEYIFGNKEIIREPYLIYTCEKDDTYYIKLEKDDRVYFLPKKV